MGSRLNPPDKSLVLCLDEKSQIQALDRTQPGLPLKKGRCGTFTHDYVRHGTTTLFAALEILEGKVIGQCFPRHRHQEFLRFLRRLDDEFPEKLKLHLVLDNYGTHKHPKVRSWLERHPRFTLHFIPTSSSWLNQVERPFWRVDAEGGAPRSLCQCRRVTGEHSAVPAGVERSTQTVRVDGDGRKDNGQSGAGAAKTGRNQAGVGAEEKAQKALIICLAVYGTLH